jgi:hypothetical protein
MIFASISDEMSVNMEVMVITQTLRCSFVFGSGFCSISAPQGIFNYISELPWKNSRPASMLKSTQFYEIHKVPAAHFPADRR